MINKARPFPDVLLQLDVLQAFAQRMAAPRWSMKSAVADLAGLENDVAATRFDDPEQARFYNFVEARHTWYAAMLAGDQRAAANAARRLDLLESETGPIF